MCSVSFADLVFDKLFSISSKMKENSFKRGSSLCLMADSPNLFPQLAGELMNDLLESGMFPHDFESYNSFQSPKVEYPLIKNLSNSHLRSNLFNFSPHILNVVHDSMRYLNNQCEMLVSSQNNVNIANMLCDRSLIKPPAIQKTYPDPNLQSVVQKLCPVPNLESVGQNTFPETNLESEPTDKPIEKSEIKMSVTVRNLCPTDNSDMANKFHQPNGLTLNFELANRKTKEIQKRSKKRRRRQKKTKQSDGACTESTAINVDENLPKSSRMCYSKNSNSDSFIVTVKQQVNNAQSLTSSFVISVGSASDDESDWDSCSENAILTETPDFELTGLFVGNLCAPNSCLFPPLSFDVACSVSAYSQDEAKEVAKYKSVLLEVNKKWNKSTKGITDEPKIPSKVFFASEDYLEEVFPIENYDRKGEWELYALERLRFKRRIDELEKIISPCLTPKHRLKIYSKLMQSEL